MRRWTLAAPLLFLFVILLSGTAQAVVYPNAMTLNDGTVAGGSFPTSVTTSDDSSLHIQGTFDDPVWYIDVEFEFDLNPLDRNRLVMESRSDWSVLSTCSPCYQVTIRQAGTWKEIIAGIYWTSDTVELYDLTTLEAQEDPIKIRVYHQDVGAPGNLYIDQMYIDSWETDEGIVSDDKKDPPEDDGDGETETSLAWFDLIATLIIFLIAFALLQLRMESHVRAFAVAGVIAVISYLLLSGLITRLMMAVIL